VSTVASPGTPAAGIAAEDVQPARIRRGGPGVTLLLEAWRQRRTKLGAALTGLIILIAVLGPLAQPHDPNEFLAAPYAGSSGELPFGADKLGRDVLSQFLGGGRAILIMAALATVIGVGLGVVVGLTAAYSRALWDNVLMRAMDVVLSFPAIILALVVISTAGASTLLLIVAVGLTNVPRAARVIRGAAVEVARKDFVLAAAAMGLSRRRIVIGELLPNVVSPLVVELSLRMTYTIGLIASLFFLGFAPDPAAADWGLMINANRSGLSTQPFAVALPVMAIALLTIGTSLIGDGFARAAIGIERGSAGHGSG